MDRKPLLDIAKNNFYKPRWWIFDVLPFIYNRAALTLNKRWHQWRNKNKWNILDEEWDTLIILDGCRADLWQEAQTPWDAQNKYSPASSTPGFLLENFSGEDLLDTVYVTANPQINNDTYDISTNFHHIDHVWDWGWDDTLKTVPPETMTEAVLQAHKEYPDKRIVAHYVQPHHPFIGKKGRNISKNHGEVSGWEKSRHIVKNEEVSEKNTTEIWSLLRNDVVEKETVWEAYRENLEITMPYVEEVVEKVNGNIAITSDHGNLLGERIFPIPTRLCGHPVGLPVPELVEVPWVFLPSDSRRQIRRGSSNSSTVSANVESRLSDLGYRS